MSESAPVPIPAKYVLPCPACSTDLGDRCWQIITPTPDGRITVLEVLPRRCHNCHTMLQIQQTLILPQGGMPGAGGQR